MYLELNMVLIDWKLKHVYRWHNSHIQVTSGGF